jgi:hypothetical protein
MWYITLAHSPLALGAISLEEVAPERQCIIDEFFGGLPTSHRIGSIVDEQVRPLLRVVDLCRAVNRKG